MAHSPVYRSVMLQLVADCARCRQPIPLPGATEQIACPHCNGVLRTPPRFWRRVLAGAVGEALTAPPGKGRTATVGPAPTVRLVYGRMDARCAQDSCRYGFPVEELEAAVRDGTGMVFCRVCGGQSLVRPAPEWLGSVHPAVRMLVGETPWHVTQPPRWFALLDVGGAVDALPHRARVFVDFGTAAGGRMTLAWHGDDGQGARSHLALVDRRGLLLWQQDAIPFGARSWVLRWPEHRRLVLVDADGGRVHHLDENSGRHLWTMPRPDETLGGTDLPDVRGATGVALDVDGSLLLQREQPRVGPVLRRYGPEGPRWPLWPGRSIPEEDTAAARAGAPRWDALPHAIARLPDGSFFVTGWDGHLYVAHAEQRTIAKYGRDGGLAGTLTLDGSVVRRLEGVGVDRQGLITVLFTHAEPVQGRHLAHVAHVLPGGQLKVWMGAHAPQGPFLLGTEPGALEVGPEGTVFLGGAVDRLRVATRDGQALWQSPFATTAEERLAAELNPAA